MRRSLLVVIALCSCGAVLLAAEGKSDPTLPDFEVSAKLAENMPKTVSGTVFLDGQPLAGARVTDGLGFVLTGSDGRYEITLTHDAMLPYLPSRTVSVCWPDNTWPELDKATGRWEWWARLMDIKDPANTDFRLVTRRASLPLCISYGTDPHDAFERPFNQIWPHETRQAGDHVDFAVGGGDLWYIGMHNAEEGYAKIAAFTREFPTTLIHLIGNHDIVAVEGHGYDAPHELAGQGGFTKHIGAVRWSFDMAGVRFIGVNWPLIDDAGQEWLDRDLATLAEGRPAYLFVHMWSPHIGAIVQKYPAVKLVLCGHSHRNIYAFSEGGAEFWTKMSLYTLLYVDDKGFEFVDRCIYKGGRNGWDGVWGHDGRACALYHQWPQGKSEGFEGEHVGLADVTLDSEIRTVETVSGGTYDIRIGAKGAGATPAGRWGVRITGTNGVPYELSYDTSRKMLNLMGRETHFDPELAATQGVPNDPVEQEWVEMRIQVQPDRIKVIVNSRVGYELFPPGAPIPGGALVKQPPAGGDGPLIGLPARKIEFFAEGGAVQFGRVDVWQRSYPEDYVPRRMSNSG